MMDSKSSMIIYYAFFHSLINYGVIAWGGAYDNNMKLIHSTQKKILKIINKNKFSQINPPLEIRKLFHLESISFHYASLRTKYINSASQTRNKSIQLPKSEKRISDKNSYDEAIRFFNGLPKDLKVMTFSKQLIKKKLKLFIAKAVLQI